LIEAKQKKQKETNELIRQGKKSLSKLYNSKRPIPDEFATKVTLPEQLPEKMLHLESDVENLLRKNYLNIFRKGLVEYTEGNKIVKT
jgi:hypothetical protein